MNKIKYIISRSIQMLKEQWIWYFLKLILAKCLGKNFEFVNFIFRKWNYYFRGSDIGFAMIKDSYEYMQLSDYQAKYNKLVAWLDDESIKTVDLFIKHINLFYHNNVVHESELFGDREKKLYEKSCEFMGKNGVLHATWYGLFENDEMLQQIWDGAVIDVWASDWAESLMFAKLLSWNRDIYPIEPSSYNYALLKKNIENSPYKHTIHPQKLPLGQTNGEVEIYWSGWVEVSVIDIHNKGTPSEKVEMMTIDSFVEKKRIKRVGLIKWDIEWVEMESIIGSQYVITRDKPVLVVSIYHNGKEFFETKWLLESWNLWYKFKVLQWEPWGTWVWVVLICY